MNASISAAGAALLFTGCYLHTQVMPVADAVPRAPTCVSAVAVYALPGDVAEPYAELAHIALSGPADMIPTAAMEQDAARKQAARLGANGLILGHALDERQMQRPPAVAIFIPADSARAARMCAGALGTTRQAAP